MDRLKALEIFKAVADRGSFVRAASALDLSCAVVTRTVQELEGLLGLRLLHRTTRHVSLTCDGEDVLHRAASLLDTFADLASLGRARDAEVAGRMHVLAPAALGPRCLGPILASFMARHPKLCLNLELADELPKAAATAADLILFLSGSLPDSFVVRRLCEVPLVVAGSEAYLRSRGHPTHAAELARHACLACTGSGLAGGWRLSHRASGKLVRHDAAGAFSSNSAEALLAAAIQGAGLVLLPHFLVAEAIELGELQPVLPDWQAQPASLHVGFGSRQHQSARVRALIDHLARHLAGLPATPRQAAVHIRDRRTVAI